MRRSRAIRYIAPFAAAVGLALVIDVLAKTTSWSASWTYALAGFGAALLLVLGTPFAFGRTLRFGALYAYPKYEQAVDLTRLLDDTTFNEHETWTCDFSSFPRSDDVVYYDAASFGVVIELKQPRSKLIEQEVQRARPFEQELQNLAVSYPLSIDQPLAEAPSVPSPSL